ncbi:MAG: hypothetical protein COW85_13065, partial [Ignavibacteria bacterium CG22_combo_CG10-13_8_21_14_all_37_15]
IGFLILPFWRSKNNYFLYFKHTYLPISGAPEQECRTIPTTFYLLKILFNRTSLNKKLYTEEQSQ